MCQASNFVSCVRLAYSQPRPRSQVRPTKQPVSLYPRLACSAGPSRGIPKHSCSVTGHRVACNFNGKARHVTTEYHRGSYFFDTVMIEQQRYSDCSYLCISSLFLLSFSRSALVSRAPRSWRYTDRSLLTICVAQSRGVGSSSNRIW